MPHFLASINLRSNYIINLLCLFLLIILFIIKPVTYDLSWYYVYFELVQKNVHEFGFEIIVKILNFFFFYQIFYTHWHFVSLSFITFLLIKEIFKIIR